MSIYSVEELGTLGFAGYGKNLSISKKASIYNPGRISIGDHVRIDDFCVLSAGEGGIEIGDYIHMAVYCSLMGTGKIQMGDFSGLSCRVSIFSSNEDYTGTFLTNPTIPAQFRGVTQGNVVLSKHVIIGAGSVVLPGVSLGEGSAVGALSLVTKDCPAFGIYCGVPARRIRGRKDDLLGLEMQLRKQATADSRLKE